VERFIPLSNFAPEREVPCSSIIKANELDGIQIIRALGGIAEIGVVLVVPELLECRGTYSLST
jgi:hypothetical protein